MEAVDWSGLGFLAVLLVACIGYLSRQNQRTEDRLRADIVAGDRSLQELMETRFDRVDDRLDRVDDRLDRVDGRLDRLEERYVRHLEQHATTRPASA